MEQPLSAPLSPEKARRRRFRKIGNFCGALVLAMYAMQILITVLVGLCAGWGWIDRTDVYYGLGLVGKELLDMGVYLLFLAVPALLVVRITRTRLSPFPTRRVHPSLFVCLVFGGMAMAIFANVVTSYVMVFLEGAGVQASSPNALVDPSVTGLVLALISTAVFPALIEEMVFRGFLLGALRPLGNGAAVLLSALVFGLFHGNVQQFVFAFLLGVALAFLTVQTGSIWPAVVLHFSNNAMSVILTYCSNFYAEEYQSTVTLTTFALVCFAGVVAVCVLLVTDRKGTGRYDVLRPVGNGLDAFSPAKRVGYLFTAPLWVLALVVMLIEIAGTVSAA